MRNLVLRSIQLLAARMPALDDSTSALARKVVDSEGELIEGLKALYQLPFRSYRSRIHGNLHLGQVLHTGDDFVFIDLEGEPSRPYGERRIKRTPLRDIAGVIRSLHHVADAAFQAQVEAGQFLGEAGEFECWLLYWRSFISARFVDSYRKELGPSNLVPQDQRAFRTLLYAMILDAAFSELSQALLTDQPKTRLALQGIIEILEALGRPE